MNKRVVVVTGGGSGIGAAISRAFIANGDIVVIVQRTEASIAGAQNVAFDLSELDGIPLLVEQLIAAHQRIDVLVNNAGMMSQKDTVDLSRAEWQATLDLNLTAPFLLIKEMLPELKRNAGSIVNISSIEADAANPGHAAYCASKAGLNGLTRGIAVDQGVRCNAIAPGWIDSEFNAEFINQQPAPESFVADLQQLHPAGRIGQPEDIAQLAVWLASPDVGFVTGQVWTVDGGRTAKLSLP
ncbi:MAG: SDR family oxidoreductase [Gammaproteobacteria bacterium]|nr:SDR family oxidoreductase [Gammaproteobacteria bacterium]